MSEMEKPAWWPDNPYRHLLGRKTSGLTVGRVLGWDEGIEAMYAARQWQVDTYEAALKYTLLSLHGAHPTVIDEITSALLDVMGQDAFENWMNNEMEV